MTTNYIELGTGGNCEVRLLPVWTKSQHRCSTDGGQYTSPATLVTTLVVRVA